MPTRLDILRSIRQFSMPTDPFAKKTDAELERTTDQELIRFVLQYLTTIASPNPENPVEFNDCFSKMKSLSRILNGQPPSRDTIANPPAVALAAYALSSTETANKLRAPITKQLFLLRQTRGLTTTKLASEISYQNIHGLCGTLVLIWLPLTFIEVEADPDSRKKMKVFFYQCLYLFQKALTENPIAEKEIARKAFMKIMAETPETRSALRVLPLNPQEPIKPPIYLYEVNDSPSAIVHTALETLYDTILLILEILIRENVDAISLYIVAYLKKDMHETHSVGLAIRRLPGLEQTKISYYNPNFGTMYKAFLKDLNDCGRTLYHLLEDSLKNNYLGCSIFVLNSKKYEPFKKWTMPVFCIPAEWTKSQTSLFIYHAIARVIEDTNDNSEVAPEHIAEIIKFYPDIVHENFGLNKTNLLMHACGRGNEVIVKILIHHGAPINYASEEHKVTPLHFAAHYERVKIVKILIQYPQTNVNVQTKWGATPLSIAIFKKNKLIVGALLTREDIVTHLPYQNKTLLDWSKQIGDQEIVAMIEAHEAKRST